MPDARAVVALIIILFIVFSPDPQAPTEQIGRNHFDTVLEQEEHSRNVLSSSHWSDFNPAHDRWLNVSGFTNSTDFAWDALASVRDRARQLSVHAIGEENAQQLENGNNGAPIPLYNNVTGVLHGKWVRSPISADLLVPRLNQSRYTVDGPFVSTPNTYFGRNLTGTDGSLKVRLGEADVEDTLGSRDGPEGKRIDTVRSVNANIEIQSESGDNSVWELRASGVHFLETGNILLATTSEKFAGIFALPHLAISEYNFEQSKALLNRTTTKVINRQKGGTLHNSNPWTSAADGNNDTPLLAYACELVVYLQQQPRSLSLSATPATQSSLLRSIEDELRFPTGAVLPAAEAMQFSLLAFSPDCGYALESKGPPDYVTQEGDHLIGPKVEVEYNQARRHLLSFTAVLAAQLWLLTRQMEEASTPSTRSRISFYTIAMLGLGDGFTTMSMALVSLFIPNLWVLVMATCFLAFLSVSFFGMRFLLDIWTVHAPERERADRQRRAAASPQADVVQAATPAAVPQIPVVTPAGANTLPLPVTARRPVDTGATPIIVPSDQDDLTDDTGQTVQQDGTTTTMTTTRSTSFGALYTRFYLLLLISLFLSLNATSWPAGIRRAYFTLLAFLYLSFWIPQIVRNANRNCRRALRWDFVVGQSLLRLVPFAYFYGYSSNVVFASVDMIDLAVLAGWVWLQCVLLVSQELIGARWFVKSEWVPPAYDYHPLLREDEEGGNLPIGFSQATASAESPTIGAKPDEDHEKGKKVFDCAICMQDLEVSVAGPDGAMEGGIAGAGGLLARRGYMVTPCRHIFHSPCLEGWMKYRLQCPICREELPPL